MKRLISLTIIACSLINPVHPTIENLVDIKSINPNIRMDLRYATTNNFTGQVIYTYPSAFLHIDAALALDKVQKDLEAIDLGLLVWDGYRSSAEQKKMWDIANQLGGQALQHVSNPATSPGYKSRGHYIELTLVDKDGNLLDMPTDFDELTERAHSNYMNLPEQVMKNRALLHFFMKKHGFVSFEKEWWHFSLDAPDWEIRYPIIEATIQELEKITMYIKLKNPKEYYNDYIDEGYPSYVSKGHLGLCLRASDYIAKGTVVASANFTATDKTFIAHNPPSHEYYYVALMNFTEQGQPIHGQIRGKWAFCNHSCDSNCDVTDDWLIVTNREVQKDEELTTTYNPYIKNFPWQDNWTFECKCNAACCKKIINEYRMDLLWPVHNTQK